MGIVTLVLVGIASLAGFLVLTTSSLLVFQPLQSSLVRLRANYLPRAITLGLGDEDAERPRPSSSSPSRRSSGLFSVRADPVKIGPVTSGVFGMAKRVVRLEGWRGLYRGAFPGAVQMIGLTLIGSVLLAPFVAAGSKWKKAAATGDIGVIALATYLVIAIFVNLPMSIVSHRTIVHPHPLPWTQPLKNLRELLSPRELRNPWRLYALPGMASVCILHTLFVALGTPLAHRICFGEASAAPDSPARASPLALALSGASSSSSSSSLPADTPAPGAPGRQYSAAGLTGFLVWSVFSAFITIPLQCATIRLSTQRPWDALAPTCGQQEQVPAINPVSHQAAVATAQSEAQSQHQHPYGTDDENAPLAPRGHGGVPGIPTPARTGAGEVDEPVVMVRPCASSATGTDAGAGAVRPYTGLADCLRTMVQEEGIESIYRGWGVSALMLGLSFAVSFS